MPTLKLTIFKAKILKNGSHKIRIAICHKQETCYIVTRFTIDSLSEFKNGQVVKRQDASAINVRLRKGQPIFPVHALKSLSSDS